MPLVERVGAGADRRALPVRLQSGEGRGGLARLVRLPRGQTLLALSVLAVLTILVLVPMVQVVVTAGQGANEINFRSLWAVLSSTRIIGNTLLVAVGATIVSTLVGGLLAFAIVRVDIPGRRLLERLVILPLYVTPLLTAIGWSWLGSPRAGLVNLVARRLFGMTEPLINLQSGGGVVFVAAMSSVPITFLFAGSALRAMDPSLEESARVHGASLLRAFGVITLPLVMPALLGSGLLVFVHAMGLFSIPAVLGLPADFRVAGTEIYTSLTTYPQRVGAAASWGLVLLVATALLVWLQGFILNRRSYVTISGKAYRPRTVDVGRGRYLLAAAAWAYLAFAVFLPILALLWAASINFLTVNLTQMKFDLSHFHYVLFDFPKTYIAAWNSFILSVAAACAVCALALPTGWVLVRSRHRLRDVIDMLGMAPVAIPSLTFALGLLWFYVGKKWLPIYGTVWILLLAYATHFLPFGIRAATSALRQMHPELEEAARIAGASWGRTLRLITFPLIRPALAAVWALVFIMGMQEVSASILLYTNRSIVLSVAIYSMWEAGNISNLAALAVLQLAFMFVVIGLVVRSPRREFV